MAIDLVSITTGDGSLGFVLQGELAGDFTGLAAGVTTTSIVDACRHDHL